MRVILAVLILVPGLAWAQSIERTGTNLAVIPSGASTPRTITAMAGDFVRPENYKLASDPDDTLSLNRAAATGRVVMLEDNKTYTVTAPINVSHGIIAEGKGATIVAGGRFGGPFIHNMNPNATSTTDTDIIVENITFDGTNIPLTGSPNNGGFHAIEFRMAQNILVRGVKCINVGNCTAMLADKDTVVTQSWASGITNVAYDHWDGPQNATVSDSVAYCAIGGTGVMFTGASTANTDRTGFNLDAHDVKVFGPCSVAVDVNELSAGSMLSHITLSNILFDAQGSTALGIRVLGNSWGVRITNPIVKNSGTGANNAIAIVGDGLSGTPHDVTIDGAYIENYSTAAGNYAVVQMYGLNERFTNARIKGGIYTYAIRAGDPSIYITGTFDPGSAGAFDRTGSTPNQILSSGIALTLAPSYALTALPPDGTSQGGNVPGQGSVSLQQSIQSAAQIASGSYSTISGGRWNAATGNFTWTVGSGNVVGTDYSGAGGLGNQLSGGGIQFAWGNSNLMYGTYTQAFGQQATDRSRYGGLCTASGQFATQGDAMQCAAVFRATTANAAAVRLTSDGTAANAYNCLNIPDNTAVSFSVQMVGRDVTSVGPTISNLWRIATMSRGTGAASVLVTSGSGTPDESRPVGTVTGAAASITADTTNGCLNISATPPTGNAHIWHFVATVRDVEVQ